MKHAIPLSKPYLTGREQAYIAQAIRNGQLAGNGPFTRRCQDFFEARYNIPRCLLTASCTDALEMAAILCNIQPGDEVIVPSFTFISSANAFVLRGAKIILIDSKSDHPNMDEDLIESLITPKTKAIVVVHYAGMACRMDKIMKIANQYQLKVIEDAAQAIEATYQIDGEWKQLGTIGHLGAISFHETKNITSGEGGILLVNDEKLLERAEIVWEKGTDRMKFLRGKTQKYLWQDVGSSFLMSEINAAFLWAQIEALEYIQQERKKRWNDYFNIFINQYKYQIPHPISEAKHNAHNFYFVANSLKERDQLIGQLKSQGITSSFHYIALHLSPYYQKYFKKIKLINAKRYSDTLIRIPLYPNLSDDEFIFIQKILNNLF